MDSYPARCFTSTSDSRSSGLESSDLEDKTNYRQRDDDINGTPQAKKYQWKRIKPGGTLPLPLHGHRAVNIKDLMVVFGGGNAGIKNVLHVYDATKNLWSMPVVQGETPTGCAAFGFAGEGKRIFIFGGMTEHGKYSNELYELTVTKWRWRKMFPEAPDNGFPPTPRLGHSFTVVGSRILLFGGLTNESSDPMNVVPKCLNDLYALETNGNFTVNGKWNILKTYGTCPTPRESHTAIAFSCKNSDRLNLLIYGGMDGRRLGDLWLLDVDSMTWTKPLTSGRIPLPRSLHTATLIDNKMFVFGGWVPEGINIPQSIKKWKGTNSLAVLHLESMTWEEISFDAEQELILPFPRAGHCAVGMHGRLYIWSGRYARHNDAWRVQVGVCCDDLWYLEVGKPTCAVKAVQKRAIPNCIDLKWKASQFCTDYVVDIKSELTAADTKKQNTQSQKKFDLNVLGNKSAQVVLIPQNGTTACSQSKWKQPQLLQQQSSIRPKVAISTQCSGSTINVPLYQPCNIKGIVSPGSSNAATGIMRAAGGKAVRIATNQGSGPITILRASTSQLIVPSKALAGMTTVPGFTNPAQAKIAAQAGIIRQSSGIESGTYRPEGHFLHTKVSQANSMQRRRKQVLQTISSLGGKTMSVQVASPVGIPKQYTIIPLCKPPIRSTPYNLPNHEKLSSAETITRYSSSTTTTDKSMV